MLGHATSSPYHRPAGSAPEPPYYNPMPSLRMGPNWQNPVHGVGGLRALQSPYSTQQLPPVHYGPVPTNPPSRHQPQMPGSESAFGQSSVSTNNNHLGTYTPPVTSTPPAPVQDSPQSGVESPSVPEPPASEFTAAPAQAPLTSTNVQFGSAPPSSDGPFLYRSYRPTAGGGFSGSSTSLNNPVPAAPPAERRRVVATPLRRLSRRTSPPSDRDYDEVEFRMLEHAMGSVGRDIDDNHIRNAQMMRGSVTTKMVASISAIQSLQSVDVSDLSESERSCIICYNDFGVETPEGVKEAPLRLPKCKHIFGDHCIKKCAWMLQIMAWGVFVVFLYPQYFSALRTLPGPKDNHWLMGQYPRIMRQPTGIPMIEWINTIPHEGIIRYRGLFNQERLLITSPKALAEVLVTHNYDFHKPTAVRSSIGRILGIGVLLAEGDNHKVQRKNLMPAFAFRHVKDLYPLFWSKACEGVDAITDAVLTEAAKPAADGTTDPEKAALGPKTAVLEIGNWASRTTLDIIGMAGMGRDFGAIRDPSNPLNQTYQHVFKPSRQAQILAVLGLLLPGPLVHALPFKRNGDIAKAAQNIRATCRELIREKKDKLERKQLTDIDILSVALESGGFTEDNLVDQMMTFLAAGHETTASAMMWAIYCLCLNPEVQSRLRLEIRERLPIPGTPGDITALDIDHMPYLNAVCNEVLRYYAPVPMTLREAAVDTVIDGNKVPKGTRIMLCPWATNKDTALWGPDAGRFDPDRWMPRDGADPESKKTAASGGATSNYAFMTFLHGPRSCIGQGFAKAEFACILASWIGRFEFSLKNKEEYDEKNITIKGGVTARPAKGLHVYVKVIDGW
ncbi:hypothetical protein CkaCkLH20_03236 [Colletotrichum karsti]|uniref:Cytochrome P450 monooxygenase FUM15 n=1 Tax=Colletotrichum karsti TaxID=1095194 RepID=A0A9P6I9W7_9PEZI|nr:uncharacterized protein CkaCkLH20_03236 [Colletotrichum karsti]KAF9879003.1 hypothetical protein CkaCkLH20_03236 [Colletotrichum karsti]